MCPKDRCSKRSFPYRVDSCNKGQSTFTETSNNALRVGCASDTSPTKAAVSCLTAYGAVVGKVEAIWHTEAASCPGKGLVLACEIRCGINPSGPMLK